MEWIQADYLRYEDDNEGIVDISVLNDFIIVDTGEEDMFFHDVKSLTEYLGDTFGINLKVPSVVTDTGKWYKSERHYGYLRIFVRKEEINDYRVVLISNEVDGKMDIMEFNMQDVTEFSILELTNTYFETHGFIPENDIELMAYKASDSGYEGMDKIHRGFKDIEIIKEVLLDAYNIKI